MSKDEFLDIVMRETALNRDDAQRVTVAVLNTLRSQLSKHEKDDIREALPEDIDRLWEGTWLLRLMSRLQSIRDLDRGDFIELVRQASDVRTTAEAERIAEAVFSALKRTVPQIEVEHISGDLPDQLRQLWKAA